MHVDISDIEDMYQNCVSLTREVPSKVHRFKSLVVMRLHDQKYQHQLKECSEYKCILNKDQEHIIRFLPPKL